MTRSAKWCARCCLAAAARSNASPSISPATGHHPSASRRPQHQLLRYTRRAAFRSGDAAGRGRQPAAGGDGRTTRLLVTERDGALVSRALRLQHQPMARSRAAGTVEDGKSTEERKPASWPQPLGLTYRSGRSCRNGARRHRCYRAAFAPLSVGSAGNRAILLDNSRAASASVARFSFASCLIRLQASLSWIASITASTASNLLRAARSCGRVRRSRPGCQAR